MKVGLPLRRNGDFCFMERELLCKGLEKFGYKISDEKCDMLEKYSELLKEKNKIMNLTAITDSDGITIKHFLDSIVPVFCFEIPEGSKIIDVGTGAGFPGMPIKMIRDDLKFTFMDSLNKRINFLKEVAAETGIKEAEFVHMRAEEGGRAPKYRQSYETAVSRAVAPLKILSEYCIPFVKVGGIFAAFKSYDTDDEIKDSKSMIGNLGGVIEEIKEIEIPFSDIKRKIIIVRKEKNTPSQFPRSSNKIAKSKSV